jgi:transposase
MLAAGHTREEVADHVGVTDRTIRRWLDKYNCGLEHGLFHRSQCVGRPRLRIDEILKYLLESAPPSGYTAWTPRQLHLALEDRLGNTVSVSTLDRRLKTLGVKLPRWAKATGIDAWSQTALMRSQGVAEEDIRCMYTSVNNMVQAEAKYVERLKRKIRRKSKAAAEDAGLAPETMPNDWLYRFPWSVYP